MLLFRSTFITAFSAFIIALCAFSMCASAAPQFNSINRYVDAVVPEGLSPNPSIGQEDQGLDVATSTSLSATSTSSTMSTTASASASASASATNDASTNLCGGTSVVLGVTLSVMWLVF